MAYSLFLFSAMEATGKGAAWGNSLFEDNAEYGLGQAVPPNLSSAIGSAQWTCSFWLFSTWYIGLVGLLCAGDECSTAKAPTSQQSWSGPRTSCKVHDNGLEETHWFSRLKMHVPACVWRKDLNINNMDNRFDKLMYFLELLVRSLLEQWLEFGEDGSKYIKPNFHGLPTLFWSFGDMTWTKASTRSSSIGLAQNGSWRDEMKSVSAFSRVRPKSTTSMIPFPLFIVASLNPIAHSEVFCENCQGILGPANQWKESQDKQKVV